MSYESKQYPEPSALANKYPGRTLIIGSGPTTKRLIPYKHRLKEFFDTVIVCNYSFKWFDDVADIHIVSEKTSKTSRNKVPVWLKEGNFRTDIPRVINWKGIENYPQNHQLYKTNRALHPTNFNPRQYHNGLLVGPTSHQGFALGSTMLCAMHLAAIVGTTQLTLIGAELLFTEFDHWYGDTIYRNPDGISKQANLHQIVEVEHQGEKRVTTAFFRDSALVIDKYIEGAFHVESQWIPVSDFSNGLIKKAHQMTVEDFFDCRDPECTDESCRCA